MRLRVDYIREYIVEYITNKHCLGQSTWVPSLRHTRRQPVEWLMQSGPICIRGIMGISLLQSCSQDNRCRVQDQGLLGQSQELQVLVKNEGDRQEK